MVSPYRTPAFSLAPQPQAQGLNLGGADPNAAYQMPRLPWAQNDAVTAAAFGLLGGRTLNEGLQNAAQMVPAGLASNTAKRRDMYSLQEKARTDAEAKAEKARQYAAMNVGLKLRSGIPLASLTPAEQAAWAAAPDVAIKLSEPQVLAEGSTVWNPMSGPPPAPGTVVKPPKTTEVLQFQQDQRGSQNYKMLAAVKPAYESMQKSATVKGGAADLDIIYGIAKLLDPLGAVRDQDTGLVKNSAGYPQWLQGIIEGAANGQELSTETRNKLLQMAEQRMTALERQFNYDRQAALRFAERRGFNEDDVLDLEDITPFDPALTTGGTAPPPDPNL